MSAGRGPRRPDRGRRVGGPSVRDILGGEQVEGRRAVLELLRARRRRVRDIWVSDAAERDSPVVAEILELAGAAGVTVRRVNRARLDSEATSQAPQGVLAHAEALPELTLEQLVLRRQGAPPPFLVVVDGVTDPQNLGAVFRVADGAGATGIVLPRHRAASVSPTVAKAAAGAVEYVSVAVVAGIPAALRALGAAGVWCVGLAGDAGQSVFGLALATEPLAVVLGAESAGLSRLVRQRCDALVCVPQLGGLASLNVAAAAAVACFEVARQRSSLG